MLTQKMKAKVGLQVTIVGAGIGGLASALVSLVPFSSKLSFKLDTKSFCSVVQQSLAEFGITSSVYEAAEQLLEVVFLKTYLSFI